MTPFRLPGPDFMPITLNENSNSISFARMSEDSYRSSPFLDHRAHITDPSHYDISIDDLLESVASHGQPTLKLLFHTAFCCSTLLCRYFEAVAPVLVLKEPLIITQLAASARFLTPIGGTAPGSHRWNAILRLCLTLLSRTYRDEQAVLIKFSDVCGNIASTLLATDPSGRAVALIGSCEDFLISVLRFPSRRRLLRGRALSATIDTFNLQRFQSVRADTLSDAELAAYIWSVNVKFFAHLSAVSDQMTTISTDNLLADPSSTICALSEWFDLPHDKLFLSASLAMFQIDTQRIRLCRIARRTVSRNLRRKGLDWKQWFAPALDSPKTSSAPVHH